MRTLEGEFTVSRLEDLRAIAARLNASLQPGDILLLEGDLGAGKTTFTQMLAEELGAREEVVSPTFTVEARYVLENDKVMELIHIDLYRLAPFKSNTEDALYVQELFEGALNQKQIVVIEWSERLGDIRPGRCWQLQFKHGSQETNRTVTIFRHA